MSLIINHNLMAMNAARSSSQTYNRLSTSVFRLASGLRINSAADDAAGLAIREIMRSDIRVLNQGVHKANDAISLIQTADGALSVIAPSPICLSRQKTYRRPNYASRMWKWPPR
jgi:flagellin